MTDASVRNVTIFRAKVYARDFDPGGLTVHADSWGNTKLCLSEVSWVTIGGGGPDMLTRHS